ncbi:MAG TPA: carboxypeptidase regulatory-like domain-containing protein [Bryobacteraceae bacterium]|nr:carboxypeptidase regulatory-like domain-containing protein [Bryobacteraceae bacterium]
MQSVLAGKRFATTALLSALLAIAGRAEGGDLSLPVTGNLLGSVVDAAGTPQRGATVRVFNKYQQLVSRTVTAPDGRFAFASLPVDLYSVRVALASFLPAARDRVAVRAGANSVLQIHLTTLFSSIEVKYNLPGAAMSDDWKWVLRSSPATRLITRYLPDEPSPAPQQHKPIFTGTRAMVSLSGGGGGSIGSGWGDSELGLPDVGTGFALATNLLGNNELQFGGAFGQNTSLGVPAMGLCAIYRRDDGSGFGAPPEVTLMMSQFGLVGPQQLGSANAGGQLPTILRTMSLSIYNVLDAVDNVHIEYGMTAESVDYLQHTSRVSPFARMTVSLAPGRKIVAAYSDGARPDELTAHQQEQAAQADAPGASDELANTASTMTRLPQISNRDGMLEMQRTQSYEVGYTSTSHSHSYSVSAFHEVVSNGRVNVAGTLTPLNTEDLLWDGVSPAASYNIGNYTRNGYIASADQQIDDMLDFQAAFGRMGGFAVDEGGFAALKEGMRNVAAASVKVRAPVAGTRIVANYGWVDAGTVIPMHAFTTQNVYISPGLNLSVRQPLPSPFGMSGHFELTADIRNLLAQGYLPVSAGSHSLIVVQAPRVIRGGVNFIF